MYSFNRNNRIIDFDNKNCNKIINKNDLKTNNFSLFSLKLTNIADENKNNNNNIRRTAAADSGCTSHFISDRDRDRVEDIIEIKISERRKIYTAAEYSESLITTHKCKLKLTCLPREARDAYIVPGLSGSLLSISKLCDNGLKAIFTREKVEIWNEKECVLSGQRKPGNDTHLWMINLEEEREIAGEKEVVIKRESIAIAYQTKINLESDYDRVAFAHATMGSPPWERFAQSIKSGYINIAGVTHEMARKNPIKSEATAKGHLDQSRSNFRSTKGGEEPEKVEEEKEERVDPRSVRCVIKTMEEWTDTGKFSADSTGKFPVESDEGDNYIMVMVHEGTGYIKLLALKKKAEVSAKIQEGVKFFEELGALTEIIFIDNEISADLRNFFKQKKIELNLVPPGNHRANPSERGVRTAKNHIIATFATADKQFPLKLWGKCMEQIEITLALTRECPSNPRISTYEALHGHKYNFDGKPMAPVGTRVIIHNKSSERNTWGAHGQGGWYVGPALSHYRCFKVVPNATGIPRVTDTLEFFPETLKLPGSSPSEALTAVLQDLVIALKRMEEGDNSSSRVSNWRGTLFGVIEDLRATYSPMEDVKAQIEGALMREQQEKALEDYVDALRAKAEVKTVKRP